MAVAKSTGTMRSVRGSRRRAATVVAATALVLFGGTLEATAQLPWRLPTTTTTAAPQQQATTTTTTSTTTTSTTTTTTEAPSLLFRPPAPDEPAPRPAPARAQQPPAPVEPAGGGDGTAPADTKQMPAHLRALMSSVRRTPANNTRALLAALQPLEQYGLDATQRAIVGFGRFPIAAEAVWSDDWWFPRFGPGWRLHEGIDIFAPHGSPVRAPVDGRIRVTNGKLGGLSVYVVQPDGTYWYLAHLSGIPAGIAEGVEVKTGQVVGFVGTSGNARGGKPHLHMEIHPRGGGPIPPKAVIDRFVVDALAMVPQLLDAYARAYADRSSEAEPVAPVVAPAPAPELTSLSPREALLWASAASPAGGTLRLAEHDALAAASTIDWTAEAEVTRERALAEERARRWFAPLVPEPLAAVLGMPGDLRS